MESARRPRQARTERFGRLTVVSFAKRDARRQDFWTCKCDCGKEVVVRGGNLRNGHTRSCGCLRDELPVTHRHTLDRSRSPEYLSWSNMIQRCTNRKHPRFADWGGRGITVCSRWLQFENFLADMGPRPKGKSIDRWPDPDGNYEPENCRWATAKEQANNHRKRLEAV